MGKVEEIIKSEIVRLARKEVRKVSRPLGRDLRSLKSVVFTASTGRSFDFSGSQPVRKKSSKKERRCWRRLRKK